MNLTEAAFVLWAEAEGWKVTKRGWPDFICRRGDEVMAVEVKGHHDWMRPEQWAAVKDLRMVGLPTFLWTEEEGLSELTAGVSLAESVQSLRQQNARLLALLDEAVNLPGRIRQAKERTHAQLVDERARALAKIGEFCVERHPSHKPRPDGTTYCVWLLVLSEALTIPQIAALAQEDEALIEEFVTRASKHRRAWLHDQHHRMLQKTGGLCQECVGKRSKARRVA